MTALANLIGESIWVSQYNPIQVDFGLGVHVAGELADADGPVTVTMATLVEGEDNPTEVFSRAADHIDTGLYSVTLSSAEAAETGFYRITWSYEVGGQPQSYVHALEVVPASSALESLPEDFHAILDAVWMRFSDLFDSPYGGPHLQVYYQTRFNRGRVAELMGSALRKLNVIAQPHMTYTIDGNGGKKFPVLKWGGVLEQATFIECVKHLIRSYVEQPETPGVNVARLDRRDYMNRWRTILGDEEDDYEDMIDVFKIAHMGLSSPRVMVSGGVYGTFGPTRLSHSAAARPRYFYRFYA